MRQYEKNKELSSLIATSNNSLRKNNLQNVNQEMKARRDAEIQNKQVGKGKDNPESEVRSNYHAKIKES